MGAGDGVGADGGGCTYVCALQSGFVVARDYGAGAGSVKFANALPGSRVWISDCRVLCQLAVDCELYFDGGLFDRFSGMGVTELEVAFFRYLCIADMRVGLDSIRFQTARFGPTQVGFEAGVVSRFKRFFCICLFSPAVR